MKEKNKFLFFLFAFFLSAAIVGFGQPAWIGFLSIFSSIIGYSLFWYGSLHLTKKKQRFCLSFFWFCLVQSVGLSWMLSFEYQGLYIIFVYLFVMIGISLQFALASILINKNLTYLRALGIAGLIAIFEWSRLYLLSGFSFNPIGLAMASYPITMQLASLFGVFGLSFYVIMTNLFGLKAMIQKTKKAVGIWTAAALLPYFFGFCHIQYHQKKMQKADSYKIALVQTGLRPEQRDPIQTDQSIFIHPVDQWKRILSFLPDRSEKLDLIVLPEGALPFGIDQHIYNKYLVQAVFESFHPDAADLFSDGEMNKKQVWQTNQYWGEQLSKYYKCPVIIGMEAREDEKVYNAAFYFTEEEKFKRYEKCILVPGSEYMPFEWGEKLAINYGITGSFCRGEGLKVFSDPIPLSISICYEETYGHFMRKAKQMGAHLLVNVTNDMWFPNSSLPKQHFHLGKLRSIENGIPAVRACNSGVTASIDSLGRVIKTLSSQTFDFQNLSGCLYSRVPSYHYATFYSLFGDMSIISLSVLFCFFGFILRKKKN